MTVSKELLKICVEKVLSQEGRLKSQFCGDAFGATKKDQHNQKIKLIEHFIYTKNKSEMFPKIDTTYSTFW